MENRESKIEGGLIATVRVDVRVNQEFDYLVPESLKERAMAGARVRVPFGSRTILGTVLRLKPGISSLDPTALVRHSFSEGGFSLRSNPFILKPLLEVVGSSSLLTPPLLQLAEWMASYYLCPLDLVLRCLSPAVVRKKARMRPPRKSKTEEMTETDFSAEFPVDPVPTQPLPLNPEQATALEKIKESLRNPGSKPVLLFGVTGSGKTEVYLQAMAAVLEAGKSAIMLVPEIALTPQTVERLRARFSSIIPESSFPSGQPPAENEKRTSSILALLHSALSDGERFAEWQRIRRGEARVIVGARSAVFAPVHQLGLIVVDEEHEQTYKQEESPRYHARDVAVMRAHLEGAAVVLGSATPSLESFQNTKIGKYELCRLPRRIDGRKLPSVKVIDMRAEFSKNKRLPIFSEPMKTSIQKRLERGEQIILYLNRRGYASSMICKKCGHVVMCPHCSVSLVYHFQAEKLKCHLCGFHQTAPRHCPKEECRDPSIRYSGLGTEKLEEITAKLFPSARIVRMDSDTMRRRKDYEKTLLRFKMGKFDILLGTQMIAKGLDFPRVTLVGIIFADVGLHLPDFRSGERAFQQITQVAGRAGRGDVEGEVIIQTFTPHHLAVRHGQQQDFEKFFMEETHFRKELDYPPFNHLTQIEIASANSREAEIAAGCLRKQLEERMGTLKILGPCPAPLGKLRGRHRYHLLLRDGRTAKLKNALREILSLLPRNKNVLVSADVDPFQML